MTDIINVPVVTPLLNPQWCAKLFDSIRAGGWVDGCRRETKKKKTKIGFSSFIGE